MSPKHIPNFKQWLAINESDDDSERVEQRIDEITQRFEQIASSGQLKTSDFMGWLDNMLEIYDGTSLSNLVFGKMKKVFQKYFNQILPITSMNNRELTRDDIATLKRYKQITADEARFERDADAQLRDLGLI